MNILYLSCHSILEYDETSLFMDMGHNVFTLGDRWSTTRPKVKHGNDWTSTWLTDEECDILKEQPFGKMDITNPDMVEVINKKIDHIMFAGRIDYVEDNWDAVKDLDVTCSFRLIGQTNEHAEGVIRPYVEEGLKLIHYSPEERFTRFPNLPYTEIRFYKNPEEFNGWSGHLAEVLTVTSHLTRVDGKPCNAEAYFRVTSGLPSVLYGYSNEDIVDKTNCVVEASFDDLKQAFRDHRAYYYTGTRPASYTLNFIEAWMTGIPVCSLGRTWETREIPFLIETGKNGFVSDNIMEAKQCIQQWLDEPNLAKEIGQAGREKAIELFGIDTITEQWAEFFTSLGG